MSLGVNRLLHHSNHNYVQQNKPLSMSGDEVRQTLYSSYNSKRKSDHVIRCAFVVILAILLLLIAVSGIFILLISNDCGFMYAQTTSHYVHLSSPDLNITANSYTSNSMFYSLTICQLTLIIFEVLIALMIIFFNQIGCDSMCGEISNTLSSYAHYQPISTSHTTKIHSHPNHKSKCSSVSLLKILFIVLISVSFILRLFIFSWAGLLWTTDKTQMSSISSQVDTKVSSSSTYLSGLIYATTLFESLLFILVLTTNTNFSNSTTRANLTSR